MSSSSSYSSFMSLLPIYAALLVIIAQRPAIRLRRKGALSPDTALPLSVLSAFDQRRLPRLIAKGFVREARPGYYYYDAEHCARVRAARRPLILALVGLGLVTAAATAWLTYRQAQGR